jgi:hypothetical protein
MSRAMSQSDTILGITSMLAEKQEKTIFVLVKKTIQCCIGISNEQQLDNVIRQILQVNCSYEAKFNGFNWGIGSQHSNKRGERKIINHTVSNNTEMGFLVAWILQVQEYDRDGGLNQKYVTQGNFD